MEKRIIEEEPIAQEYSSEVSKSLRMRFLDLKTDGGQLKRKIAFYCSALGVSRQGFYWFLKHRDDPWKYADIADKMRTIVLEDDLIVFTLEFWASLWQTICVQIFVHPQ